MFLAPVLTCAAVAAVSAAAVMTAVLQSHPALRVLIMSNNAIGDNGAAMLLRQLQSVDAAVPLQTLDLSHCKVGALHAVWKPVAIVAPIIAIILSAVTILFC
jgi:hypothetical protein